MPLLAGRRRSLREFLGADAKLGFQFQIALLLLLDVVEILLMPFVDFRARLAETVPQRLFVFVGDRSDLAPLLVQFLQFVESRDDGSFQYERIGFLAKLQLGLVVLLQVQIAQFLVDLWCMQQVYLGQA